MNLCAKVDKTIAKLLYESAEKTERFPVEKLAAVGWFYSGLKEE